MMYNYNSISFDYFSFIIFVNATHIQKYTHISITLRVFFYLNTKGIGISSLNAVKVVRCVDTCILNVNRIAYMMKQKRYYDLEDKEMYDSEAIDVKYAKHFKDGKYTPLKFWKQQEAQCCHQPLHEFLYPLLLLKLF